MKQHVFCIIAFCVVFLGGAVSADETSTESSAISPQDIVRAKIGIELHVEEETRLARKYEQVLPGDKFRIYVIPEPDPVFLYIVYSDQDKVEQVEEVEQTNLLKDTLLIVPSLEEIYEFDDSSASVSITVICSATELSELVLLLDSEPEPAKWIEFEQQLIEQSTIDLRDVELPTWELGSGIRGGNIDVEFLRKLKISSGKSLVIRRYEFTVGK